MQKEQRHIVLLVPLIAMLAGCTNLPRTIEPESIFPAPSSAMDMTGVPTSSDGTICTTSGALMDGNRIPSELTQFSVAMYCAYTHSPSDPEFSKWMKRFVDKGIALSNQTCERFFDQLEARRTEASYAQTNFNVGATAVTAVLAFTENHHRAIFNLATLITAGNAWFENYKSNYVMTPQLRKLHDLVQTSLRDPVGAQIIAKSKADGYPSFDQAKQDIMRYDALCSHKVLQDIVTESIAKADLKTFVAGPPPEKLAKAEATRREIHDMATGGPSSPGSFAEGEFEALYIVATTPDAKERVQTAKALTDLLPKLGPYVKNLGLDIETPTPPSTTKFLYVDELLNLEGSPYVAALRKQLQEKVVANNRRSAPQASATRDAPIRMSAEEQRAAEAARQRFVESLRATDTRVPSTVNFRWEIKDHRKE